MTEATSNLINALSSLITAVGLVVGGLWALYTGLLKRSFESGLGIAFTVKTTTFSADKHLAYLEVTFRNTGHRRLKVPRALHEKYERSVAYPADLQVKRIVKTPASGPYVDWWSDLEAIVLKEPDESANDTALLREHVSLLHEYEEQSNGIDFFMEPGEECQVGVPLVLERGHYLAKIVVVGERAGAAEYWSRIVYFQVAAPPRQERPDRPAEPGAEADEC